MVKCVVIFDFDNTLVRSNINFPAMKIQMARYAKKFGMNFGKLEEIPNKYTAGNIIDQAEIYDKEHNTAVTEKLWGIVEKYERMGLRDLTIDEEIYNLLNFIQDKKHPMVILTNNAKRPTIEVLKKHKLDHFFELVIAREDVTKMKPDKEGLELITNHFSIDPMHVVFIGDSWVDGLAANSANIRFILYKDRKTDASRHDVKIWKHIKSLNELEPIISNDI